MNANDQNHRAILKIPGKEKPAVKASPFTAGWGRYQTIFNYFALFPSRHRTRNRVLLTNRVSTLSGRTAVRWSQCSEASEK